ncbi:MAG: AAA family ATPase, partial [Clostridia bacterium]
MKLERMRIGSFGVLTDLDLKPGPGLTIIAGNNESGKSTLAAFIPALIFGFPDARSNLNRYPSLAWGRRGGWIEFSSRGRRYRAERWYERGGKVAGNLTLFRDGKDITDADAEDRLIDLWGGLSGDAHRNLLTFGLSELEDVGTLDTEKIARLLYTTAAGIDARSLERIRAELHRRKMELYRPRARSRIGDLLEQLESLARERTSESDLAEHRKLRDELRRERRATRRARERLKVVAKERDAIEAAHRARPLLGRIREIEAALEELDVPVDFPTDATARLDHLSGALEEANEEIEEIRAETEEISAKLHNLELTDEDRLLLSRREEIRRLHGEVSAISERLTRRDKLAAKLQHLSSEALDVLHELGDDWGDDYTKLPVVSLPLRERIHDTKRQIDGLQNQVETIQARESELERAKLELSSTQSSDAEDTRAFGEQTAAEMRSLDDLLQLRDTRERLEERIGYVTLLSDTGGARPLSPMPSVLLALLGLMGAVYWAIADHAIHAWIIGISGMTAGLV